MRGKAILDDLRGVVKTEIFEQQLDEDLKDHANIVKQTENEAERFGAVLGKPSPTWETTDLAGGKRSIEGCRGKVVVLDFWYRGCGWCIRAMPQVKQLAAHYQGQPVEIFGMNTDDDEADVRFVVERLGLTYPTLKADGLPEKYGVRGFPTLVIIDPSGVVRRCSCRLHADAGKKRDRLGRQAAGRNPACQVGVIWSGNGRPRALRGNPLASLLLVDCRRGEIFATSSIYTGPASR